LKEITTIRETIPEVGTIKRFAGRSLDVFISKLRKYFSLDPSVCIENIPKVGFILQDNS